ncbi:MAG: molybdopterin-dependent oxidoreductase [Eggerthellaceae bacterium]|nr:molybdopterin-dependent oxidoreductase [Eggerthellaceae bacterium]
MKEWKEVLEDGTEVVRSAGWSAPGCHPTACGVRLFVKDGKLVKVEGDPDHPITQGRLCVRCLSLPEAVNHPDRLLYPMKRKKEDRGKDTWERCSWDEALDIIKENYDKVVEEYGLQATVAFEGTGRMASIESTTAAFNVLLSPHLCYAFAGYSCYGPRIAITVFTAGAGIPEMDYAGGFADRYDDPRFEVPKYIVIWGKEPLSSNADGMFGHAVTDLMHRGAKLIVIDPRVTWLAAHSEYFIQLRPGTDTALALGLLRVIIDEDLYDHDFVENWTLGFDALKERLKDYPVEKVAEICDVDPEIIRATARAMAEHPVSCTWGVSVDQNKNGLQMGQAILTISAITGNLDVPGGTVLGSMLGSDDGEGRTSMNEDYHAGEDMQVSSTSGYQGTSQAGVSLAQIKAETPPEIQAMRIGSNLYPAYDMTMNEVQPDYFVQCIERDEPYPVRFAWIQSSNFLSPTCSAQPDRWMKAFKKMDFTFATDVFMNPTIMALADVVLPVAMFPEADGVVMPQYGMNKTSGSCIVKALQMGECRSDAEINYLIGKKLNPTAWPDTLEEYMSTYLDDQATFAHTDFEGLKKMGTYQEPTVYKKYEKGLLRADGQPGFNTTSGKFEIKCSMYKFFGDDPLPYYEEPTMSPVSTPELFEEYPIVLTTGGRKFTSFHSEHRQIETLRNIDKWPRLEINPETAKKYGVEDGAWVWIENPHGKAKLMAEVTAGVKPGVVHATHGWWFPEQEGAEPNLYGVWKSNINTMVPNLDNGKIGFGAPFKNVLCKVYPAVDNIESPEALDPYSKRRVAPVNKSEE